MTERVRWGDGFINYYHCKDCGDVWRSKDRSKPITTLRPNRKWCSPQCMEFVLQREISTPYTKIVGVELPKLPSERMIRED